MRDILRMLSLPQCDFLANSNSLPETRAFVARIARIPAAVNRS
jgi:hypothetical protein